MMKTKLRNVFLAIGIVAVAVMLATSDMSYVALWQHVQSAGCWFWAAVLLWIPIYLLNAWSWYLIIHDGKQGPRVSFLRVFKYTVSGYALNYVTPVGVLGGEPYRIMELSSHVGGARASSSVILYAMMHIFSHFCFWLFSLFLFVLLYAHIVNWSLFLLLLLAGAFCLLGIWFFMKGYRHGMAVHTLQLLSRWPLVDRSIGRLVAKNRQNLEQVDRQIAELHAQRRSTFYVSLFLEFLARVVGCLELLFILYMLPSEQCAIGFADCILMQAFMSLFANLLFFIPLEMGTREGGFALVAGQLSMPPAYGVLTGLVTRVRELLWIAVGLLLMKVGNRKR